MRQVKKLVNGYSEKSSCGWQAVLVDLQSDAQKIKRMIQVVERKIAKGEPWPGEQEVMPDPPA